MSINRLMDSVAAAPSQSNKKKKVVKDMGSDPFQTIAARLHAIRKYMMENNKKDGNIEIEARFGLIINTDYDGRTGSFTPGAGAVEILADAMKKRRFVSGVTKRDFQSYHNVQERNGSTVERSNTKDFKYSGRRIQVDENGELVREVKTRELESQFHLPSCPYDCRITVSIEREITEEEVGEQTDDWESCRHKLRTSYCGARLPNKSRSTWQVDLTTVTLTHGKDSGEGKDTETTYEVELELSSAAVRQWFSSPEAEKETGRVAWDLWECIQAMMPREETCSSLKEEQDPIYGDLAREAVSLPWGPSGDSSGSFPGTLPVGFGRRMIEKVQKDGYMVSEKTDGVRHLMAVVQGPGKELKAILIDRKMRIFTMPGMEKLGEALGKGALIDGEVVRNRSWKRDIFMAFDLLHDGKAPCVMQLFPKRLQMLSNFLSERYMKACLNVEAKESMSPQMKTLPIILKHFYPASRVVDVVKHISFEGTDRVYLELGPDGKPAPALKRHHKSDGLIFAPNTTYCRGTDFDYLKWKWHDMITLDFEVTWGGQAPHGMSVAFAGNGSDLVDFTEHVVLPSHDLYRLRGDMASHRSMVGEFEFSPEEGAWLYKLPRPDKKKSNYSRTVLSTLMELAEGMDVEEVVYRLSFKGGEGDDWEAALKAMRQKLLATRTNK